MSTPSASLSQSNEKGSFSTKGFNWKIAEPKVFFGVSSSTGNEAYVWLNKMERIRTTGKLSDEDMLFLIGDYLAEKAETWFNVIGIKAKSWEHFVSLFKKQYLIDQEDKWWSQLQEMSQGPDDSIDDIALKMEELFELLDNKNKAYQVRTFLTAIDSKIAYEVEKDGTPNSFAEAKSKAKQIERILKKYGNNRESDTEVSISSGGRSRLISEDFDNRSDVSSLVAKLEQLSINLVKLNEGVLSNHQQRQYGAVSAARQGYFGVSNNNRVYTCYFCNEPGHKKYECPKMPKNDPVTGANAVPIGSSFVSDSKLNNSGKGNERQ
jgi:hypothetical protein